MHGIPEQALLDRRPPGDPSRLREAEIDEAIRDSHWRREARRDLLRTMAECAVLLAIVTLTTVGVRWLALLLGTLVAAPLLGTLLHARRGGRFTAGAAATLAFALLVAPAAGLHVLGVLVYAPFVFVLFAIYGVRLEFRAQSG